MIPDIVFNINGNSFLITGWVGITIVSVTYFFLGAVIVGRRAFNSVIDDTCGTPDAFERGAAILAGIVTSIIWPIVLIGKVVGKGFMLLFATKENREYLSKK